MQRCCFCESILTPLGPYRFRDVAPSIEFVGAGIGVSGLLLGVQSQSVAVLAYVSCTTHAPARLLIYLPAYPAT